MPGDVMTGAVKSVETTKNRDGENDVRLFQVELSDPNDLQDCEQISQAGFDCNPPVGSKVLVLQISPAYKVVVGTQDDITPEAAEGEFEIYSQAGGAKKTRLKLKSDGKVALANDARDAKTLFVDRLIEEIKLMTTTGSPVAHSVDAATKSRLDALKTEFLELFDTI